MDRMIYIGLAGAKQALEQQASVAHNMANASTPGFRAQINSFRAVPVVGEEMGTRSMVVATTPGADMSAGPLMQTGRPLDVAVRGDGWLTVQLPDGGEAYTRLGNLQVGAEGQVSTQGGRPLMGDAGPLVVPPGSSLVVGGDGVLTAIGAGDPAVGAAEVGRLKLVNPAVADLVRGDDGLFRLKDGKAAPADPLVAVAGGSLEGSNVSPVDMMVNMISLARSFETQMSLLKNAENNATKATQILALS
jgi:flagellar basal-body rod protein FlgF